MLESPDIGNLFTKYVIPWAINISLAALVYVVGRWISRLVVNIAEKLLKRAKTDPILVNFLRSILNALLLLVVVIAALDQLGVDTTSLIAVLGAAGLAVGLALKDSLQNFASGVMMIIFRPFKAGDYIEAGGTAGTVENITIFNTIFKTPDNCEVIVPNSAIYSGNIKNYSAKKIRRVDMVFGIGYNDDIREAREIIQSVLESDDRILEDPEPLIAVGELADSSVNFNVRPWVESGDYWPVKFDLTERIKLAFDESGISIPFPQRDVHLVKEEDEMD